MSEPNASSEDGELFSRRMLAQILGVVIVSSMFVLALYLVGVIGSARDDAATSPTVQVAQMPPTLPATTTPDAAASTDTDATSNTSTDTDPTSTTSADAATAVTSSSPDATEPSSPGPTTVATSPDLRIAQVSATDVRAGSADSCGTPTSYNPLFAFDSVPETAWMVDGDGVGEALTIELGEPSTVSEVGLVPGYDKLDPCTGTDRFQELRRVTAVRWTFDDGTSIDQELAADRTPQAISIDPPVVASRITMTIVSTTEPGVERLDLTAVSEVFVS